MFLPGESQGRGSLVGCCLWDCTGSDTTEATQQQQHHECYVGISHIVASLGLFFFFFLNCCFESTQFISRLLCWVAEVWDNKLDILSKDKFRCKLHRPLLTQAEAESHPHPLLQTCPLTLSFSIPRGFYKNVYTLNEHTLPEK